MAKKSRKNVPEPVQNLQESLEDMATKAETVDKLADANVRLTEENQKLQAEVKRLKAALNRARQDAGLTEDDIRFLEVRKSRIEFDRNFKTGEYFCTVQGTAPDQPRKRARDKTLQGCIKQLRPAEVTACSTPA